MHLVNAMAQGRAITLRWMCRGCRNLRHQLSALPRSLRALPLGLKWTLAVVLLIVTSLGLFGLIAIQQQQQSLGLQIERLGQTVAGQLAATAAEPLLADDRLALSVMLQRLVDQQTILGAAIHGKGHAPLHAGLPPHTQSATTEPTDRQRSGVETRWTATRSFSAPIRFGDTLVGNAIVTLDMDYLQRGKDIALWKISAATLLAILLAALAALILARHLAKPLKALSDIGASPPDLAATSVAAPSGSEDIDRILETFNRLTAGMREKDQLELLLHRYVPLVLANTPLGEAAQQIPHARPASGSVLFSDVCGFTALTEPVPPEQIAELLNDYFPHITAAAHACGGVVDSFIGDCIMVVFAGEPEEPLHALHAATCALLIREIVLRLNARRNLSGKRLLQFRTGVNSGPFAICHLGGRERMQPTVIGDTVNVAARLCGQCEPGEVVLGEQTVDSPEIAKRLRLTPMPPRPLKGRRQPVTPNRADTLAPEHQSQLTELLDRILPTEDSE